MRIRGAFKEIISRFLVVRVHMARTSSIARNSTHVRARVKNALTHAWHPKKFNLVLFSLTHRNHHLTAAARPC